MTSALLVTATVGNGLLAGLFFTFAVAVTRGLRRVDDGSYVATFRAVNAAILNPWFLVVFLGTPPVTAAASLVGAGSSGRTPWLLAALACSAATFLVTALVNVPLNRRLDAAPAETATQLATARRAFEVRWNRWNAARAAASTAALLLLATASVR